MFSGFVFDHSVGHSVFFHCPCSAAISGMCVLLLLKGVSRLMAWVEGGTGDQSLYDAWSLWDLTMAVRR